MGSLGLLSHGTNSPRAVRHKTKKNEACVHNDSKID